MHITTKKISSYSKFLIFSLQVKGTFNIFLKTPRHKRLRLSCFVIGLWILSIFGWRLAREMRSCYFWFRYVDDIIDRDLEYHGDIESFRKTKKEILENLHDTKRLITIDLEDIDWLIIDVYYSCCLLGCDNQKTMLTLFNALEYDVARTLKHKMYYTQAEIREYFDNLDIPSVIMTLQLINEKAITLEDLYALIDATRIRYNLRDFIQDLEVGIVNISIEEINEYGIDMKECALATSLPDLIKSKTFKLWFTDQIAYIEERLSVGRKMVKEKPLRLRTWLALTLSFIRPCETSLKTWKKLLV